MITLVNAIAGSRLYGTNHENSDEDTMGIGIAEPQDKLGLSPTDQDGKDDHVVYELTKFVRLACSGNPTILQLLYAPPEMWIECHPFWPVSQIELRNLCVSQKCRPAFLGYLQQQRNKLLSDRQQRPELVAKHGYDTKFAAHMIRLGIQGIEVLSGQGMALPMRHENLDYCLPILEGKVLKEHVLMYADGLENRLKTIESPLPLEPDYAKVNEWLANTYIEHWGLTKHRA